MQSIALPNGWGRKSRTCNLGIKTQFVTATTALKQNGTPNAIWTRDPDIKSVVLYQLSYGRILKLN